MGEAGEAVGDQTEHDGSRAVDQHIPWRRCAVGQERLMPFVADGDCGRAGKRQQRVGKKARLRQTHPPGAQPGKAKQAVADEVAGLANAMVNYLPAGVAYRAEDRLVEPAERARRVVGAQPYRRFD